MVSPDTCTNIDVAKGVANGLYSTASTFVVPANTRRNQVIKRTAADLTLTPATRHGMICRACRTSCSKAAEWVT